MVPIQIDKLGRTDDKQQPANKQGMQPPGHVLSTYPAIRAHGTDTGNISTFTGCSIMTCIL